MLFCVKVVNQTMHQNLDAPKIYTQVGELGYIENKEAIVYRQKHILLIYKQFTVKLASHVGKLGPTEKYHQCNIKNHKGGIQKLTWKCQGSEFSFGLTEVYNLHQGGRRPQPFSPGSDSKSLIFRVKSPG